MNLKFIHSKHAFCYIRMAFLYGTWPWKIYDIVHSEEYLARTKDRVIHDRFYNYITRREE